MKVVKSRHIEAQNSPNIWKDKTAQERLEALEEMRKNAYTFYYYGKKSKYDTQSALQKLFGTSQ